MASVKSLKSVIAQLKKAVKAHAKQAKTIQAHIDKFHKKKK